MGWKSKGKCPECKAPIKRDGKSHKCTSPKCTWSYTPAKSQMYQGER